MRVNEICQTIPDKRTSIKLNKGQKEESFSSTLSSTLKKDELNAMKDSNASNDCVCEMGKELMKLDYDITTRKYIRKDTENVQKELSELSKYDIRNASFDEIKKIAFILLKAGQITTTEHGSMTFDLCHLARDLKEAGIPISGSPTLWLTSANANGKRDWITEWEARAEMSKKMGLIGYEGHQNIVNVLKKIWGEDENRK